MRRPFLALAALLALTAPAFGQLTVTFENSTLNQPLNGANMYQNGATLNPPGSFTTNGATFNNTYTDFGGGFTGWSGWSYSNVYYSTLPTTGSGNFNYQYGAYNAAGAPAQNGAGGSANYGVANSFSPGDASIALPAGHRPLSMQVTNTAYAALSMLYGDGFAKKFGGATGNDADFFLLTITGKNAQGVTTGTVDVYLADFRFADNSQDYILSHWTTVDLASLGADTTKLEFGLSSSDNDPTYGMNTPAYFAADNIVFTPVPEPATVGVVVLAAVGAWPLLRRVRRAFGRTPATAPNTSEGGE